MRRSRRIATLALGGACLLSLTACDDKPKSDKVYGSVVECVADGKDETACRQALEEAGQVHEKDAPRFAARASCEETYGVGNCVPAQSGGGWFMPAVTGFMMGRMLGGSPLAGATPVYRDRYGYSYAGGRPLPDLAQRRDGTQAGSGGTSAGSFRGGGSTATKPSGTSTTQRGGFGSVGSFFSSSS